MRVLGYLIVLGLIAAIIFGLVKLADWAISAIGKDEIYLAGKVVNSETHEWPNDRLVVAFLKGKEVARTTTALGELSQGDEGVHDGFFLLQLENLYKLDKEILEPLGFKRSGSKWWIYSEIEEGDWFEFPILEKNITYAIRAIAGDVATLPAPMLEPGSLRLGESSKLVVELPLDSETGDVQELLVQAVNRDSEVEEVERNRITVPLNNCGGSALLEQEYVQAQTFYYEYTTEVGAAVGGEVGLPSLPMGLLAELEKSYGYVHGEINTQEISYTLKARPGTNQVYEIIWKDRWEKGEALVMANGELITVPFKVRTNLIYEVNSEKFDCP